MSKTDYRKQFEKETNKLAHEIALKTAKYKEYEIKKLLTELLLSGDIVQFTYEDRYAIQYLPYYEKEGLKAEIESLTQKCEQYEKAMKHVINVCNNDIYILDDVIKKWSNKYKRKE